MIEDSKNPFAERRQHPRHRCEGAAELLQDGKRCGWGTVTDIGRGGCYIESAQALPVGSDVQLRLTIANVALFVGAKVAFSDPQLGMGMVFRVVPQEQGSKLAGLIEKLAVPQVSATSRGMQTGAIESIRITEESAPVILAEIMKRINGKGVLTRQDLVEILNANK